MKAKRSIFGGLFASFLFGLIIANSVFAYVDIGSADDVVRIDEPVTEISCRVLDEAETTGTPTSNGMKCDLTTASGVQSVYYTVAYMNNGNTPASQEEAIRQKLDGANLLAEASNPNEPDNPTSGSEGEGPSTDETPDPVNERCTSILPSSWCEDDGDGIAGILNLVLDIMTMGMGILATIGLVISGMQWLTARDKEDQIVKAKSRIFNIVIGIMVWGIMWLVLQWLLPGGINLTIGTILT